MRPSDAADPHLALCLSESAADPPLRCGWCGGRADGAVSSTDGAGRPCRVCALCHAVAADEWGYRLDRWCDERGPAHLLLSGGAPACGVSYRSTTGPYPYPVPEHRRCWRCVAIVRGRS